MNPVKELLRFLAISFILYICFTVFNVYIGLRVAKEFYNQKICHISEILNDSTYLFSFAYIYPKKQELYYCIFYHSKLLFPSGSTGYIFNKYGILIDSSLDSGEDYYFEKQWLKNDSCITLSDTELKNIFSQIL